MRTLLALTLMLGTTVSAAPVPKEIAKKTPLEKLQGRWVIVTLDSGSGQQVQTDDFASFTLTIAGDKLSTATTSGPGYQNVTVKYDFESSPHQMNISGCGGTGVLPSIVKYEDDKLYWCHGQAGASRPTEFKGGNGYYCFVWKRADK